MTDTKLLWSLQMAIEPSWKLEHGSLTKIFQHEKVKSIFIYIWAMYYKYIMNNLIRLIYDRIMIPSRWRMSNFVLTDTYKVSYYGL